jgi:predicted transposase YbfD/YdcC
MSVSHTHGRCRASDLVEPAERELFALLEQVPDPRDRRGRRHSLTGLLAMAVLAVLSGATNFREVGDVAADLPQSSLRWWGARFDVRLRRHIAPSESTFRRVLQNVDAVILEALIGGWLAERSVRADSEAWAIALDAKTLRRSPDGDGALQLISAMIHGEGVVIAQRRVPDGTNETTQVRALLGEIDVSGAVITADAAHTNHATARFLVEKADADYLMPLKGNQADVRKMAYQELSPVIHNTPGHVIEERGHGRISRWTVWTTPATKNIRYPHAAQVACISRHIYNLGGVAVHREYAFMITSLEADEAGPARIAELARGHWGIENKVHWVRDVVWREDDHVAYVGNGPQIMAALRNLAMSLIRQRGITNVKQTLQAVARDSSRAIQLLSR